MTTFVDQITNTGRGALKRVRRNHALEHATLQVLAQKRKDISLAGYSDPNGFWVIGEVGLEELKSAVEEALTRLQSGEVNLAIHPNCGTNFVTSGILAGTAAMLGMLGTERSLPRKLDRWPIIMAFATVGLIFSQPLGPKIQQRYTTSTDVQGLRIREIMRHQRGKVPMHRVLTHS